MRFTYVVVVVVSGALELLEVSLSEEVVVLQCDQHASIFEGI